MTTTLAIQAVTKTYGRAKALDGMDLRTGPGVTGLLGPNGAGKTTLMRIVATVLAPDAGQVQLLGLDPADAKQRIAIRRRLGYMPQEPGFHPSFTVFEFIDYIAILKEMVDRRARHDEVRRVIAAVGLEEKSRKRIRSLSGGMRRRVALAQALLGQPDLLVLDEPTAGLDPEQRLRFRQLVGDIGRSATVLLSTHQTEDVAALCQQVVVVHQGRARFGGTVAELAEQARGKVWLSEEPSTGARVSWRTADGRTRNIGEAPVGADIVDAALEDAYLLLVGDLQAVGGVPA